MGKSVQTQLRSESSISQKTSVRSAYSQLGGRISLDASATIAEGHLVTQRQNRAVGPGQIPHVLAAGCD